MASTKPLISIIIANYNGSYFLKDCIDSILKEKSSLYEIIVVDDCSTDKSISILKGYEKNNRLRLIALKINKGAAYARNVGAKKSRGDILFFLDYDTTLTPGWGSELKTFFSKYPKAGMAQAKILKKGTNQFDYAGDYISSFGFLVERAQGALDTGQFDTIDRVFSVRGAAMILRKSVFDKVAGFDESYGYYWEEPDIAWRIWLLGFYVYFLPTVTVHHAFGTKEKQVEYYQDNDIIFKGCRNAITTMIKNFETKNLLLKLPIHILFWLMLSVPIFMKGEVSKSYAIWRGVSWNLFHINETLKKRAHIQTSRTITDDELFGLVGSVRSMKYYLSKAISFIIGTPYNL